MSAREGGGPERGPVKPRPLRRGAKVALVAPASPVFEPASLDRAVRRIESLGFVPVLGRAARSLHGYLAGTDAERAEDLLRAFADDDLEAIWCLRGGYGCARLLPLLDFELIARHPKPLIGFSDVTALHAALWTRCRHVGFHAPMASNEWAPYEVEAFERVVMTPRPAGRLGAPPAPPPGPGRLGSGPYPRTLVGGRAEGPLIGGNLSVFARLLGTPWMPEPDGAILVLEDVSEPTYRLDGMLMQLRGAGWLQRLAGVALGDFGDREGGQRHQLPFGVVLEELLGDLGIPVAEGFAVGHIPVQTTLPLGTRVRLDADAATLDALEAAVRPA